MLSLIHQGVKHVYIRRENYLIYMCVKGNTYCRSLKLIYLQHNHMQPGQNLLVFFSKHLDWLFIAVFNATYICRTIVSFKIYWKRVSGESLKMILYRIYSTCSILSKHFIFNSINLVSFWLLLLRWGIGQSTFWFIYVIISFTFIR